jgi:uncharacterized protein (UPF0303 family)
MPTIDEMILEVENQEKKLQFNEFTSETALEIGLSLIERAKKDKLVITIDIMRCGHQLFHYAFKGTAPDNDEWIKGKNKVVSRFNSSSYLLRLMLIKDGH